MLDAKLVGTVITAYGSYSNKVKDKWWSLHCQNKPRASSHAPDLVQRSDDLITGEKQAPLQHLPVGRLLVDSSARTGHLRKHSSDRDLPRLKEFVYSSHQ